MPPAIPIAMYRLQLTASFGFAQAAERVSYFKRSLCSQSPRDFE